jgi:hypothetical protein
VSVVLLGARKQERETRANAFECKHIAAGGHDIMASMTGRHPNMKTKKKM